MRKLRDIAGYVLGGIMFVALLPTMMWLASGMTNIAVHIGAWHAIVTGLLILGGLGLSTKRNACATISVRNTRHIADIQDDFSETRKDR